MRGIENSDVKYGLLTHGNLAAGRIAGDTPATIQRVELMHRSLLRHVRFRYGVPREAYDRIHEEFRTSDLDLVADWRVCPGDLFFTPQRNKPDSYSSYKTQERE